MSLQHGAAEHQPQREVARPRSPGSAVELVRTAQFLGESNPTVYDSLSHEHHSNASCKLRALNPPPSGFEYARGQLIIAAVPIAAEHRVARNYDEDWVAKHIAS